MIDSGQLHSRPIISPALNRTLFLCKLADRNATNALEAARQVSLRLVLGTVNDGKWDARITLSDKRSNRRPGAVGVLSALEKRVPVDQKLVRQRQAGRAKRARVPANAALAKLWHLDPRHPDFIQALRGP